MKKAHVVNAYTFMLQKGTICKFCKFTLNLFTHTAWFVTDNVGNRIIT
jgi:hypothetical protein